MLDDADLDIQQEPPSEPPKRRENRGFLIVAGILGAIMILGLIAMVYYALVILPEQRAAAPELSAAQQTATEEAKALQVTNTVTNTTGPTSTPSRTSTPVPPTATPSPTASPVTPIFTNTGAPTANDATATVNALLTQAALAQTQAAVQPTADTSVTATPNTPTATASALPASGFAEDVGAPGLLIGALLLVVIILTARRLRSA